FIIYHKTSASGHKNHASHCDSKHREKKSSSSPTSLQKSINLSVHLPDHYSSYYPQFCWVHKIKPHSVDHFSSLWIRNLFSLYYL
ncbi:mCG1046441, partial [Mus musculus]